MVRRGTARPGEALFVSGSLGDAALGLALRKDPALAGRWGLSPAEAEHLRRRYVRPQPRLGARAGAARARLRRHGRVGRPRQGPGPHVRGERLCARACGSPTCRSLPPPPRRSPPTRRSARGSSTGGDDYEVLAAVPAASVDAFQSMAAQAGIAVTRIGATLAGTGVVIEGRDGQPAHPRPHRLGPFLNDLSPAPPAAPEAMRPATTRTLRGAASQTATTDSPLSPTEIQKASA